MSSGFNCEDLARDAKSFTDLKFLRITDMKKGEPVCGLPYGKTEYEYDDSTIYIDISLNTWQIFQDLSTYSKLTKLKQDDSFEWKWDF